MPNDSIFFPRKIAQVAFALAAGLAGCDSSGGEDGAGTAPESRPNVLLIVVDTLRKDHLSAYGYERSTSPTLAELAENGIRYDHAFAQAPWTTPSIGSLMTSRYPSSLGIEGEQNALAEELVLLPEALLDAGYQTAGVISHSFLGTEWNFDQGFQTFDESNVQGHSAVTSEGVTRRASTLLRQLADDDQPFFLFVHYFDPHAAYIEHAEYDFGGPNGYVGDIESGLMFRDLRHMEKSSDEADLTELRRLYDSEIAFTDRQIGILLDELRATGAYDNTLLIVTADHGEEFLDHGRFGHAKSLFDELINVPLFIKPAVTMALGPEVVEEPVALIDLYPTILKAASITRAEALAGRPLLPQAPAGRTLFAETSRNRSTFAAMQGTFKLVEHPNGKVELFDRANDAAERHNVAASQKDRVASLRKALKEWRAETAAGAQRGSQVELDKSAAQRIRELGYGGDDR